MKLISDEEIRKIWTCKEGTLSAICKAQLASCEREAEEQLKAEFEKWLTAQIKAELLIKTEAVKAELRKVKAEIERQIKWAEKHYSSNLNFGTPESTGGVINLGEEYYLISKDGLDSIWKGKGIE